MADVSIPLVSRRHERALLLQKVQHAVPAVPLLLAGAQGLMNREHGFALALAVAEFAVSLVLLRSLAKELVTARRPHVTAQAGHHHGVDWFDVVAAGMLAVEALEHWHTHHHLPRPTLLLAAVTLALGLFHGRIAAHRRVLQIGAAGIRVVERFRRFFAAWADIESIDLSDGEARILARGGRERRIDLTDLRNAAQVHDALRAARERIVPAPSLLP